MKGKVAGIGFNLRLSLRLKISAFEEDKSWSSELPEYKAFVVWLKAPFDTT